MNELQESDLTTRRVQYEIQKLKGKNRIKANCKINANYVFTIIQRLKLNINRVS